MKASLPESPTDEAAEVGNRIDRAITEYIRTGKKLDLDTNEASVADSGLSLVDYLRGVDTVVREHAQKFVVAYEDDDAVVQGTLDYALEYTGGAAQVVDWKAWHEQAPKPMGAWQITGYVLGLMREQPSVRYCHGLVYYLRLPEEASESIQITAENKQRYADGLERVVQRVKDADPETGHQPGEYCRWCDAAAVCPVWEKRSKALKERFDPGGNGAVTKRAEAIAEQVKRLPVEKIEPWLDSATILLAICQAIKSRAKAIKEQDPSLLPGYSLNEKVSRTVDVDQAIVQLVLKDRCTYEDLLRCATIKPKKLKERLGDLPEGVVTEKPYKELRRRARRRKNG